MFELQAFDGRALLLLIFMGGWIVYWALQTSPKEETRDPIQEYYDTYLREEDEALEPSYVGRHRLRRDGRGFWVESGRAFGRRHWKDQGDG